MDRTGNWIYRHIGGIIRKEPGYKIVEINPDFACGLTYSYCSVETPYGLLSVEWRKAAKKTLLEVTVPVDTKAKIHIDDHIMTVKSGQYKFEMLSQH